MPELESRRLGFLCGYYQIAHTAHRALGDAQAASDLYRKLAELFYEGNETEFAPKPLLFRVKKIRLSQKNKRNGYISCWTGIE